MEIRINFYYEKQFQQMTPLPQQQTELYNLALAKLYKVWAQIQFFDPSVF